jgi:protein TonB
MEQRQRQRPANAAQRLGMGLLGSVALHAAAGGAIAMALAWRATPAPPGTEPALQVVWLPNQDFAPEPAAPAAPEAHAAATAHAPLGPEATEGMEPEDALATMLGALHLPPTPPPLSGPLPPLPIPLTDPPPPPPDPASLLAAPVPPPPPATAEEQPEAATQTAALPIPPPPPAPSTAAGQEAEEELPLPPPRPAPPPLRTIARSPSPQPAPAATPQATALAAPVPAAAPAAIPVLSGTPRFRRPPAPPHYPDRARNDGMEGTALLRLRIAADGTTQEIRLLRSTGHRLLDEAAQAAARRWEIAPALQEGRTIEAWVDVPVRFRLDE